MPSTYAHDCFGKAVYKQLPKEIQKEIKAYGPLYMPDRRQNSLNRHGRRERKLPANRGGFAYLYGFICHFVLDHSCHGYIEEKIQKSGVTHAEIEVEFDRMLLEKHGHNPITSHLTNHIPTDATCAGVIAEFFPEVTKQEVQQAVSGCNSVSSTVDL